MIGWGDTGVSGWTWVLLLVCVLTLWALVASAAALLVRDTHGPRGKTRRLLGRRRTAVGDGAPQEYAKHSATGSSAKAASPAEGPE